MGIIAMMQVPLKYFDLYDLKRSLTRWKNYYCLNLRFLLIFGSACFADPALTLIEKSMCHNINQLEREFVLMVLSL